MANSEEMQAAISQVAVRAMRKADPPAKPHTSRRSMKSTEDQNKLDKG